MMGIMGSRGDGVAGDQLRILSDLIIASSSDKLGEELAALHAEQERLARATSEFEAARAEHDARETAIQERAEALDARDANLQTTAAKLADDQAELDRSKTELAAQTATLKQQRTEIDRDRAALAGERAAFERAKENLRQLVMR
jgi:chromosome segregation ATPase